MKRFSAQFDGRMQTAGTMPDLHFGLSVHWRGYIANRRTLLDEARSRHIHLDDATDGQLFALAYRWWGEELQARVLGEYTVVIFDENRQTLLLTHDALGLVPLFYATKNESLLAATHLEDLMRGAGPNQFSTVHLDAGHLDASQLDDEYLADHLSACAPLGNRTPFRGVRRLGLGETLIWRNGKTATRRTWDLSDCPPQVLSCDAEYEERFRQLVAEGVEGAMGEQSSMGKPGRVMCELSGGLDSSTVACTAARRDPSRVEAMSFLYPQHRQADESQWIEATLKECPFPWHTIDGDAHLPFGELPDGIWGEPSHLMTGWGLRRACEEAMSSCDAKVLLTGQGGDFVCFGPGAEPFHLADLWRNFRWLRAFAETRRWQQADDQRRSLAYWFRSYAVRPAVRHWRQLAIRPATYAGISPWIRSEYARAFALEERSSPLHSSGGMGRSRTVAGQWYSEQLTSLSALITALNQVPVSFEFRHPLMYRPLIEFMVAIPFEQKLHPRIDRYLQRRALRGILPEHTRKRRSKTIFDQPTFEGFRRGPWPQLLLDRPRIVERGIVDGAKWALAVASAKGGYMHHLPQFIAAATLEIWLRQLENATAQMTATPSASENVLRSAREDQTEPTFTRAPHVIGGLAHAPTIGNTPTQTRGICLRSS